LISSPSDYDRTILTPLHSNIIGIFTTITDCKFRGGAKDSKPASGAHIGSQNNFLVKNCEFEDGSAIQGGAIYIRSAQNVTIEDSVFDGNSASTKGGSIYIEGFFDETTSDPAYVMIRDCTFRNGKATTLGGAISAVGSSNFEVTVQDCKLDSNEGDSGGAIAVQQEMTMKVSNCEFESNTAATGGAISVNDDATVVVRESRFKSNSARFGASLAQNLGGSFRVSRSDFFDGEAVFKGGAVFAGSTATGCSRYERANFTGNEALVAGGAFFFAARAPPPCSADWKKNKEHSIDANKELDYCLNCEFSNNEAGYGPDYATGASVLKRESEIEKRLRPSERFEMRFSVVDYYGQTLKGFIDSLVSIKVSNESVLLGDTIDKQPERDGTIAFTNLRWGSEPGSKVSIRFYTEPPTTETEYTVSLHNCNSDDQVLYVKNEKLNDDQKMVWYCLDIQDPDPIAKNLTYAGVAVILFLSFVFLVLLFWKRKKKPIKSVSPVFCYTIVVGVILSTVSVSMWTTADNGPCVLRGWLLVLGTSLIFGSLFVREWRLLMIFKSAKLGRRIFTNKDLAIGLAAIVAINLVVLIVWTAVAPPYRQETIKMSSDEDEITYECDVSFPSSVFVIILIVLQALLLAFNCLVSFFLRNLPSTFNESKHIAFTVYNSAIMMIVAITLIIIFNDDKTAVLVILALVSR